MSCQCMMGDESKEQVKEAIVYAIEIIDDHLPVVGSIMDLPAIDRAERAIIGGLIDALWDWDFTMNVCEDASMLCSA